MCPPTGLKRSPGIESAAWVPRSAVLQLHLPAALKVLGSARQSLAIELHMAMGHNLWRSHFGVDEHPFATNFDVQQGYKVLTHSHRTNMD